MSFQMYSCVNCGFWQQYFTLPPACPVCTDVRNALPENGWNFVSDREAFVGEITCQVAEIDRGVWMFSNRPAMGIGSSGYLIEREYGNIAFEAAGWYTTDALDKIEKLGGIRYLSASHPHGFGALWQLEQRFAPEFTIFQRDAVQFTKALSANLVFDDRLDIGPDARLLHVGGHYEGQSVLYFEPRKLLFCGDALKFDTDGGRTVGVGCHKAFHKQIPLAKSEIEKYRTVIGELDFSQVCTPFEHCADARTADAVRLFDAQLAAERTFFGPIPIERNYEHAAG